MDNARDRIAVALVALLMDACSTNPAATKPSLPPITPIMLPPGIGAGGEPTLDGRVWAWQRTDVAGKETIVPDHPERYTIEFQRDGRVQVRSDCNRGSAGYTQRENQALSITAAATTKMGCPQGTKGDEFVRELAEVEGYDLAGRDLMLTLKANAGAMRFAPLAK